MHHAHFKVVEKIPSRKGVGIVNISVAARLVVEKIPSRKGVGILNISVAARLVGVGSRFGTSRVVPMTFSCAVSLLAIAGNMD